MARSAKYSRNKSSASKVRDFVEPYSTSKDPVVELSVGSGKGRRILLAGFNPVLTGEGEWFDIYHNKKIRPLNPPLHYHSKMELVELAQEGVRAGAIDRLADLLDLTQKQVSEFFHFSDRSLSDYIKKNTVLDPDSSEKILKIFSLYLYGLAVFGRRENFIRWLIKPSFGLRNKEPISLLSSSDGIDLVQEELSRIEVGDFA